MNSIGYLKALMADVTNPLSNFKVNCLLPCERKGREVNVVKPNCGKNLGEISPKRLSKNAQISQRAFSCIKTSLR